MNESLNFVLRFRGNKKLFQMIGNFMFLVVFVFDSENFCFQLRSKTRHICMDTLNKPEDEAHDVGVYNCHDKLYMSQVISSFHFNSSFHINFKNL